MGWEEIAAKLPLEKTEEQKQERAKIFDGFDPNGNGYLSLAECDRGCRDILGLGDVLPKPVIMRAYQISKDIAQKDGKNMSKNAGDYIERNEFRLFLVYLNRYLQLWRMFSNMDDDNDRRMTYEEFEKGINKLIEWGVTVEDPKAKFNEIDTNNGGVILFDEFSKWAMEALLQTEKD